MNYFIFLITSTEHGAFAATAEEMLDEQAKEALHQAFIQAEVGLGLNSVAHYEKLASELEKSWSV